MKMKHKALVLAACAVLLVAASVLGTMAYLTSTDTATNTFTVGSVKIKLDEADVKKDGTIDTNDRVKENEYHLIPGSTYKKDPTVTVLKDSEKCYVRMMVTCTYSKELDAIFAPSGANMTTIFDDYKENIWKLHAVTEDEEANTRTYEFRYADIVAKDETKDTELPALFESITIPNGITKEQLATLVTKGGDGKITDQFTITVVAHAIQADGFDTADQAWANFQ